MPRGARGGISTAYRSLEGNERKMPLKRKLGKLEKPLVGVLAAKGYMKKDNKLVKCVLQNVVTLKKELLCRAGISASSSRGAIVEALFNIIKYDNASLNSRNILVTIVQNKAVQSLSLALLPYPYPII